MKTRIYATPAVKGLTHSPYKYGDDYNPLAEVIYLDPHVLDVLSLLTYVQAGPHPLYGLDLDVLFSLPLLITNMAQSPSSPLRLSILI